MGDISCFWRNYEFHDATLLLGTDSLLLEQARAALQETLDAAYLPPQKRPASTSAQGKKSKITKGATASPSGSTGIDAPPSANASSSGASTPSEAAVATDSVLTIPVHRIILSTGSDYFKTAICTLIGDGGSSSAAGSGHVSKQPFHPIIMVHEEDVDAAQGVLQFLYTKTVDGKDSTCASKLMHLLLVADRWVVAGCVMACCKALAALPVASLSMADVLAIYGSGLGPIPSSLLDNPDFKPVLELALSKLLHMFGNVPTVVSSPDLTAQLLQLPHAALLALLGSDALTTDCEDSVLMLLSWWLEGQEEANRACSAQLLSELQEEIRYSRLSPTYLAQALPLVPRLSPSALRLSELHQYHSFTPTQRALYIKDLKSACPAGWFKPQRSLSTGRDRDTISLSLSIPTSQLSQHLDAIKLMETGGPEPARVSAAVDFRGLSISLFLVSEKCTDTGVIHKWFVYVQVDTRLPTCSSMAAMPLGVPGSYNISIHSNVPGEPLYTLSMAPRFVGTGRGWPDFAHRASQLPGDSSVLSWWDSFIIDGQVKFTAEFTDERKK